MADETCSPCDDVIDICINTGPPGPRGSVGKITQFIFYPAVGTTEITGTDKSGTLMEVDPDGCLVSINGVMLEPGADYTIAADGLTVTLSEGIVNANDVLTVQTWKSDEQASDNVLDLKLEVEKNTSDIAGLDVRVTQNEDDIETLQNAAQSFTTRDVKVSGVNTTRAVDEPLQTQQDVNLLLDQSIAGVEERVDSLEAKQPENDQGLQDLSDAIEENAQGISDTATALNDLTDVVTDNVDDITNLQNQVNNLPDPYDDTELQEDVTEIGVQVAKNTLGIADNKNRLDALEEPVSLDELEDSVEDLDNRVTANESDIKDIKATDASQQVSINDLEADVTKLQNKTVDTSGFALTAEENQFLKPQSVKDGLKITGSNAFVQMDNGTTLEVSNGNFSDSVIDIKRSNGDTAISLEASGHIRGVKTDGKDGGSAVSVEYFQANVGAGGGDVDMALYATKLELTDEEKARILGDQKLAEDLEEAILTEKYNDTALTNRIAAEEKARAAGDSTLSNQIANETQYREDGDDALQAQLDALQIPGVDPALYATVVAMHAGDAETLAAANKYTNESIAAIEFPDGVDLEGLASEEWVAEQIADFATENFVEEAIGAIEFPDGVDLTGYATEEFVTDSIAAIEFPAGTVVGETPPADAEEGATWYDTARLELFVFASSAWLPCSPLGARVEQGEVVQAQILSQINVSLAEQEALRNRVGNLDETALVRDENGHTSVEQEWRLRSQTTDSSTWTFLKIGNNELGAYHLQDPKEWHHAANRRYVDNSIADGNFASKDDANTFKENQTFQKSSYFQNAIIHNGKNADTLTEVRGDHEDGTKQFWNKIRGTCRVSWICYPGQENKDYKKCLEMEWDAEANRPLVKLDYLQTPTESRHAATKSYVDAEVAKAGGGSDGAKANSGTTTPSLSTGEMFFNTNDKVLYIGE